MKSLLVPFAAAAMLAAASIGPAQADARCEPDKLATKYPGLAGKAVKVAQDGQSPPFSFRDPKDFNHITGLDAELARAVFKCAGGPIEITPGAWSVLLPAAIAGQADVMWDILYYTPARDPAEVQRDVQEGWVRAQRALEVCGVVLDAAGRVDTPAIEGRRRAMSAT